MEPVSLVFEPNKETKNTVRLQVYWKCNVIQLREESYIEKSETIKPKEATDFHNKCNCVFAVGECDCFK